MVKANDKLKQTPMATRACFSVDSGDPASRPVSRLSRPAATSPTSAVARLLGVGAADHSHLNRLSRSFFCKKSGSSRQ